MLFTALKCQNISFEFGYNCRLCSVWNGRGDETSSAGKRQHGCASETNLYWSSAVPAAQRAEGNWGQS